MELLVICSPYREKTLNVHKLMQFAIRMDCGCCCITLRSAYCAGKKSKKRRSRVAIHLFNDPRGIRGWAARSISDLVEVIKIVEEVRKEFKDIKYGFITTNDFGNSRFTWCPPGKKLYICLRPLWAIDARYDPPDFHRIKTTIRIIYIGPPDLDYLAKGDYAGNIVIKIGREVGSLKEELKRKISQELSK